MDNMAREDLLHHTLGMAYTYAELVASYMADEKTPERELQMIITNQMAQTTIAACHKALCPGRQLAVLPEGWDRGRTA